MPGPHPGAAYWAGATGVGSLMRRSRWRDVDRFGSRNALEQRDLRAPSPPPSEAATPSAMRGAERRPAALVSSRPALRRSQQIGRTADASAAAVEHVRVDHGGLEVAVAE